MEIGLIIAGVFVIAGSFIYAAINMGKQASSMFDSNSTTDPFSNFGGMFKRHIGAMIGMVTGVLMIVIGIIMMIA